MAWNFYWVREWDGTLNMVCAQDGPRYDTVSIRYGDGTTHNVRRSYFNEINAGRCSSADLNVAPAQCWSPKL